MQTPVCDALVQLVETMQSMGCVPGRMDVGAELYGQLLDECGVKRSELTAEGIRICGVPVQEWPEAMGNLLALVASEPARAN